MKKNRIWMLGVILSLSVALTVGCQNESNSNGNSEGVEKDKISIVCTTFPQYDWAKQVIGEQIGQYDLTLLLDNGVDLHSYQPTAEDIAKISDCDLFIYVGGESDGWIEDALKEATNQEMQVINLMEVLGDTVKQEEIVEGMEHSHEEHHEHEEAEGEEHHEHEEAEGEEYHEHEEVEDEEHHDHHHEEIEYDEHVWLSLKNASEIVNEVEKAIEVVDSQNAEIYKANSEAYIKELSELDKAYEELVTSAKYDTLLFGDRFPFRYMIEDYHLDYYAAFAGCSAETEASFETITFLANKMNELELPGVCIIENSDQKVANAIVNNTTLTEPQIFVMDSIQSVTSKDIEGGYSYLSAMENNLEVLKEALN